MSLNDNPKKPIVVVDDEPTALAGCELSLESAGMNHTVLLSDARKVLPLLHETEASTVLLDLSMPHISGEELLPSIVEHFPDTPVIIVTGHNEIETAIRCMKAGAFDYLVKPVAESRLTSAVARAIEWGELRQEYQSFKSRVLSNKLDHPEAFSHIVSQSGQMNALFQYVETIAPTRRPVLITGETGVGKELVARAVHTASGRPGPFIAVNVAGLDDNVFSDTLFGHLRGAFTGADTARGGLIERAAGGTLFLDEIGDLEPTSQVKLLRLLQEGEYYPLGADAAKIADARIVVATNKSIQELRDSEKFRTDLYYRLQTHHVHIPPLRERREDIAPILDHFLEKSAAALGKTKPTAPRELAILLGTYPFPGNVRELESMVFEAVSHHTAKVLSQHVFKRYIQSHGGSKEGTAAPPVRGDDTSMPVVFLEQLPTLSQVQDLLIEEALKRAEGNQTIAAQMLGISRSGLNKAIKRRGLDSARNSNNPARGTNV